MFLRGVFFFFSWFVTPFLNAFSQHTGAGGGVSPDHPSALLWGHAMPGSSIGARAGAGNLLPSPAALGREEEASPLL